MKKRLLAFFAFFGCSFGLAALVYHAMALLTKGVLIFGFLPRMFLYHWIYPNQYIALVCLIYALLAAAFAPRIARRPSLAIWIVLATPLLASPLGGMLWHLHDMLAGYFPSSWQEKLLLDGALEGAEIGWLIVLLSFPYNVICALLGIRGTRRLAQRLYPAPETACTATPPAETGRAEGTDSALNDAKDPNDAPETACTATPPAEAGRAEGTDSALNDAKDPNGANDTNDAPDAAASEKLP